MMVGRQRLTELDKLDVEVGTDIRKWIKGVPTSGQGGCAIATTLVILGGTKGGYHFTRPYGTDPEV